MKILISGGTGLIGKALSNYFLDQGYLVGILTRKDNKKELDGQLKFINWDAQSTSTLIPILHDYDVIINLAGENIGSGFWTKEKKERILKSRINAGNALSQAIKEAKVKPKVFIQASAIGIYGTSETETYDEESPVGNDFMASIAAQWENSTRLVDEIGVRRVIIRTGVVLDKTSGVLPLMALPFKLFVGGPLGSGKQILSWIHLRDEIQAIDFCIQNSNVSGPVNLSSPNALGNADFGKILSKVLSRPFWFPVPAFLLKIVLGEKSTLVLDGQNVYPRKLITHGFNFKYPGLQEALENIYQ